VKYDFTSRVLHWISALVILWATISGFYTLLPKVDEHIKQLIASFNVSITALFIPIFCFRIINRLRNQTPSHVGLISSVEKKIAEAMHILLYVLVGVVLLTGVLMMDRPILIFSLFEFDQIFDDPTVLAVCKTVHRYSTELLAICVLIHIAALFKHELSGKRILRRMV
jgi:cytochrome b561